MGGKPEQAIFIVGVEHRSGTNFLADLLMQHADCCRPLSIGEDYLLHHAQHLQTYAARLHESWNPDWRESAPQPEIGAALGRGLLSVLADQSTRPGHRLVTKTPRADRLGAFPWLFPDHPLLIIIRDGRAAVESAVRSFGWSYPKAIARWNHGARKILEFDRDFGDSECRYLIVRYEDLVTGLHEQLHRILAFLRLDAGRYDFDAADNMPVRGSSTLKAQGKKLHWTPVAKTGDFRPLDRARGWTGRQHRRFLAKAGLSQQLLGYSVEGSHQASIVDRLYLRWLHSRWQVRMARLGLRPLAQKAVGPQLARLGESSDSSDQSIPLRRAA
jgi:hypothetical protein